MIPFTKTVDGKKYTRHNSFPMTEREAERISKKYENEGFGVHVTHYFDEYYIYLQNDKGWLH